MCIRDSIHEMQEAAKRLVDEYQTSVLIKGGHLEGDRRCDLLHTSESIFHIYEEKKIESNNLHGTGSVSYTHLDVYKRQGNNCCIITEKQSSQDSNRSYRI